MEDISDIDFKKIRDLMYQKTGVMLRDSKKHLVSARIGKRVNELSLKDFAEYIDVVKKPNSEETEEFINAITTNETYFFRHSVQMNYLYDVVLPTLAEKKSKIKIWCAACSTGEEPYSLSILLKEFTKKNSRITYSIFASDINTSVVSFARNAVYDERSLRQTPDSLVSKYFTIEEASKGSKPEYKVIDSIKNKVQFSNHNLKKAFSEKEFDIIFMRNVLIYFDQPAKQEIVSNVEKNVASNGYLFISLSETINDINSNFTLIRSSMFQKST